MPVMIGLMLATGVVDGPSTRTDAVGRAGRAPAMINAIPPMKSATLTMNNH